MIDIKTMGPIPETGIGLYVHIPFCVRKCLYCDFLSFPTCESEMQAYTEALCRELESYGRLPVRTIYVGGGTPSILPVSLLGKICDAIKESFDMLPGLEWTLECNPATFDLEKARCWKNFGINRISMGVQSLDDVLLKRIGRIHSAEQARDGFHILRKAGFENISIDLIMGLPEQTLSMWKRTLEEAISWNPEHMSCYSLILEEGTPLYEEEDLPLPDEDTERVMYYETVRMLAEAGYQQYEISNFAKPGFESRHNCSYWERIPYLGTGLGAASLLGEKRWRNESLMERYLQLPPRETQALEESLSIEDQMRETFLLGLRMNEGVSEEAFRARYGIDPKVAFPTAISDHIHEGLLQETGERISLTERGLDLANQVFMEFI